MFLSLPTPFLVWFSSGSKLDSETRQLGCEISKSKTDFETHIFETAKTDCEIQHANFETTQTGCETSIVNPENCIFKLGNQLVKL